MPVWNVKFNHGSNKVEVLNDAREYELSMGAWFIESLSKALKGNENYRATALGIERISSPGGGSEDHSQFYFLRVLDLSKKETKFLFRLTDGDACSLVGITDGTNRTEAEKTLGGIFDGKPSELELSI